MMMIMLLLMMMMMMMVADEDAHARNRCRVPKGAPDARP